MEDLTITPEYERGRSESYLTETGPEAELRLIHEVDELLAYRKSTDETGRVMFLVKWADNDDPKTSWEPVEEIQKGASELLFAY